MDILTYDLVATSMNCSRAGTEIFSFSVCSQGPPTHYPDLAGIRLEMNGRVASPRTGLTESVTHTQ